MNTTSEISELKFPKTNMALTTTFAKSKKGVVVLVALCMLFFYTGRLLSSSGGGASLDASLLRGFQQDVATATTETHETCRKYDFGCIGQGKDNNCCVGLTCYVVFPLFRRCR